MNFLFLRMQPLLMHQCAGHSPHGVQFRESVSHIQQSGSMAIVWHLVVDGRNTGHRFNVPTDVRRRQAVVSDGASNRFRILRS